MAIDFLYTLLHAQYSPPATALQQQEMLNQQRTWIEKGVIKRTFLHDHLVVYEVPLDQKGILSQDIAPFNATFSSHHTLHSWVLSIQDFQRLKLIVYKAPQTTFYELWVPSYAWADTVTLWRPPFLKLLPAGLEVGGQKLLHYLTQHGHHWGQKLLTIAPQVYPTLQLVGTNNPRPFPVVMRGHDAI